MESASPPLPVQAANYHSSGALWPNSPVQLARGRQAKDPNARTVAFTVASLAEFETALRKFLDEPREHPEHTEAQLSFWLGTSFDVSAVKIRGHRGSVSSPSQSPSQSTPPLPPIPHGYQPAHLTAHYAQHGFSSHSVSDAALALGLPYHAPAVAHGATNGATSSQHATSAAATMSIQEALAPTSDPKEKMRKQRAIAKCCIDSIQKVDGFRYSFHNCWNSREDDSFRFSYYCNDSLLNKDRAANGKGAKVGKRATKPVYDCKGVLSVKFSAIKQSLDVFYKHVPIHKTYEERAPLPRKDSKRRRFLEENDPEALSRIASRPRPLKPPEPVPEQSQSTPKPKKRRPKPMNKEPQSASNSIESDLRAQSLRSLLELIQRDPEPTIPEPSTEQTQSPAAATTSADPTGERAARPSQGQQTQVRRRPRTSCNICKAKKQRCDGVRPMCHTCKDKGRQCSYPSMDPQQLQPLNSAMPSPQAPPEPSPMEHHAQAAGDDLSELERMKKELEEAKARILQLEAEKVQSMPTPTQTPATTSRPRTYSEQRLQKLPQQTQPLQQQSSLQTQPLQQQSMPNQSLQHKQSLSNQSNTLQQQPQPMQQQPQAMQRKQPHALPPSQPPTQQPMHNRQQIQNPQYGHYGNHPNHSAYTINRALEYNKTPQDPSQQPQPAHQLHASTQGVPLAADGSNPYDRDFSWPSASFYNYQNPQLQPQDQWTAPRNHYRQPM